MGSPITLSGFNQIDFTMILNAVMEQERAPLRTLQSQQKSLESRATLYGTLASKLSTFQTAVSALAEPSTVQGRSTTVSDATAVTASASSSAAPGVYDVVVEDLARAQVMASTSFPPDANETTVAYGGALTIGGKLVSIDAPVTLQGLADKINRTADIGVNATVIKAGTSSFQLVLTGKTSGVAGAFTVANNLTDANGDLSRVSGNGITFGDADNNGISGDSDADNAIPASDARLKINNISIVSSTNTVEGAIPGVTLTLLKKDPAATTTVTVAEDSAQLKEKIQKFIDAFNDLAKFADDQTAAAAKGESASVARDPMFRSLRSTLRRLVTAEYGGSTTLTSLAAIGIEFNRTGRLSLKESVFKEAVATGAVDLKALLAGSGSEQGAFVALKDAVKSYTDANGLLQNTRDRLTDQVKSLKDRIASLEERLAGRRATLQKEYIAADLAMTRLKSESSSLSSLGSSYRLF